LGLHDVFVVPEYVTKYVCAGAQPGGEFGAFVPPKISKHCIAIVTFAETFKE